MSELWKEGNSLLLFKSKFQAKITFTKFCIDSKYSNGIRNKPKTMKESGEFCKYNFTKFTQILKGLEITSTSKSDSDSDLSLFRSLLMN